MMQIKFRALHPIRLSTQFPSFQWDWLITEKQTNKQTRLELLAIFPRKWASICCNYCIWDCLVYWFFKRNAEENAGIQALWPHWNYLEMQLSPVESHCNLDHSSTLPGNEWHSISLFSFKPKNRGKQLETVSSQTRSTWHKKRTSSCWKFEFRRHQCQEMYS